MTTKTDGAIPLHAQAQIERSAIEAARPKIWGDGYRAGYEAGPQDAARAITQHDKEGREWFMSSQWDPLASECASRIRTLSREGKS